jgi:acyl-CoA thioester hydrolase
MAEQSGPSSLPIQQTIEIRVRYPEVDAMGYLHHSRFLQYFEMGRVELLRLRGHTYADLERAGIFFVVVKAECNYRAPARYDEVLQLTTAIARQTHVRIDHVYTLKRDKVLIADARTTIACVDGAGQLVAIPPLICPGDAPAGRIAPGAQSGATA